MQQRGYIVHHYIYVYKIIFIGEVLSIFSRLKIYDDQYKHIEATSYIKAVNSYNMHVYVYNYMNM